VVERDPNRATAIARAYIEELNRIVAEVNTSAAHRERLFLEDRLRAVKVEMDEAEKNLSEFSSKNNTLDIKGQGQAMVEAAAKLQGEEIAVESQLRGLEQIYTPNNVRVRSLRARAAELQHELEQLSGGSSASPVEADQPQLPYPSIRQLPILGVTYADLYRRVRIDETAFEILNREYELARIEEVKEVPVVKVIDPPQLPERRSGPPRTLIVLGGIVLSFCAAGVWLFGREAWNQIDRQNPKRMFAEEIAATVSQKLPWFRGREGR
jgi:capsule polysaccharide export protein KpsE/RkpR